VDDAVAALKRVLTFDICLYLIDPLRSVCSIPFPELSQRTSVPHVVIVWSEGTSTFSLVLFDGMAIMNLIE